MDMVELIAYILIGLIFIAIIVFWFWNMLRYKHIVRIKEVINGRRIVKDDKARDYKDAEGVTWWRLAKEKDKEKRLLPLPPSQAIELNYKGKKVVEVYRTESGEYIYLQDTGAVAEIPPDLYKKIPKEFNLIHDKDERDIKVNEWKKETLKTWRNEKGVIAAYDPLTTAQRIALIHNIRKAEIRRGKSWSENLPLFVGIGAVVILVISLMVFWGDIAKPTLDAQQGWKVIETIQLEQLELLRDIKLGVQRIEGESGTIPETIPD